MVILLFQIRLHFERKFGTGNIPGQSEQTTIGIIESKHMLVIKYKGCLIIIRTGGPLHLAGRSEFGLRGLKGLRGTKVSRGYFVNRCIGCLLMTNDYFCICVTVQR